MNFSQYNLMLLKTYVAVIGLHILQGFHIKQENIYGSNYYLLFVKILYLLWNVCGDNET
jgi:hypothetical protein